MTRIARTIVAFANTSGGRLVIGVDDNRQVTGAPEVARQEKGDFVDVEFYRPLPDTVGSLPDNLSNQEAVVIQYIVQHGSISTPEVKRTTSETEQHIKKKGLP